MAFVKVLFAAVIATIVCSSLGEVQPPRTLEQDGVLYQPIFTEGGRLVPAVRHTINLDLPPEQRWVDVCRSYQYLAPAITSYFTSLLPKPVVALLEKIMANLDSTLGDYGKEIRGASEAIGVDLGIMVALNFGYELRKWGGGHPNITQYEPQACSAILTQNSNGSLFHGRNMDWNLPDNIRNITFQCDFQRGGQTIFTGACYAGFVGVLTGMKPGSFAIEINERDTGGSPIEDALTAILEGAKSVSHLVREIMESQTDYNAALSLLRNRWVSAPVYYTITGPKTNQGAVVTRNRDFARDVWTLPNPNTPNWYLFQTNYDHWEPDPVHDARRTYGENHMNQLGQNAASNPDGLYQVLSTWPVGNNFTAQTVIMNVGTGYFQAYVRFTQ